MAEVQKSGETNPAPPVKTTTVEIEKTNPTRASPRILKRDYRSSIVSIGSARATEKITFTWENINVWSSNKQFLCWNIDKKPKHILKNVNGVLRPGELCCIMGASGAGKTTLLNVLNCRSDKKLRITGQMCINGVPVDPRIFSSVSSFVQQDDLMIGTLTVREHLIFQARLRMHKHISYAQRICRVNEAIQEFGLTKCADTKIGWPGRVKGISGGEMKRVSFASEILTDPPLMFCDEPTSGLDSFMAQNVISVLKSLVDSKGKSIICTIHQPSSQVYNLFDRILLMAEGRVAFLGNTKDLPTFMEQIEFPIPTNFNPSDFFIEILAVKPGQEEESRKIIGTICDKYEESDYAQEVKSILESKEYDPESAKYFKLEKEYKGNRGSVYKASWIQQFRAVLWRSWISYLKDPAVIKLQLIQSVIISLLLGVVYFNQEHTLEGIQNITGAMYLIITQVSLANILAVLDVFINEQPIFLREHLNGMYRTDVYFLCKGIAELVFHVIYPAIFLSICYFMIGLYNDSLVFLQALLIIELVSFVAKSFGYFVSSIAKSLPMALVMTPPILMPIMIFGGLLLHPNSMSKYLRWIKYVSWWYYGFESFSIVQWRGLTTINCHTKQLCPENGTQILTQQGFDEDNYHLDLIGLGILIGAYRGLAFCALLLKSYGLM